MYQVKQTTMTITITKKQVQVIKRFIEINIDYDKEYSLSSIFDDDFNHLIKSEFGNFKVCFNWNGVIEDNEDGFLEIDCYLKGNLIFTEKMSKKGETFKADKKMVKDVMKKLDKLVGKTFVKCKIMGCTKFVFNDNLCKDDYMFDCKNEDDDCCICKENDGKWVKLGCGHILHSACFWSMVVKRKTLRDNCPLCRQEVNYDNINRDYLFDDIVDGVSKVSC